MLTNICHQGRIQNQIKNGLLFRPHSSISNWIFGWIRTGICNKGSAVLNIVFFAFKQIFRVGKGDEIICCEVSLKCLSYVKRK